LSGDIKPTQYDTNQRISDRDTGAAAPRPWSVIATPAGKSTPGTLRKRKQKE